MSFTDLGLDPRLLRALSKRGLTKPTPVQLEAIPKTLEGKDIVARARTGSGKTLAYLLPALHRILLASADSGSKAPAAGKGISFQALVLVPTRELCEQVRQEAADVATLCGSEISVSALTADAGPQMKRAVATAGQLVVSTPGRVAKALQDGALPATALASRLQMLVLDEADLLLSYGFEADLSLLAPQVPRACQCMLMSATLSPEVERLSQMVLTNPLTLDLMEAGKSANGDSSEQQANSGVPSTISHFCYDCASSMDRLLAIMAMLRLGLVRKKTLTFVNTVDQGYRVKLFLESFGVRAALLNAELPLNSRSHILQSFNKGLFDHLIATDDVHAPVHDAAASGSQSKKERQKQQQRGEKGKKQAAKAARKDEEFGVTRGIDFKGVHTVINFDLPSSIEGYVHRVGRTGRAGNTGIAITLFTPQDAGFKHELECFLSPAKAAAAAAAAAEAAAAAAEAEAAEGGEAVVSDDEGHQMEGSSDSSSESSDEEGQDKKDKGNPLRPFQRLSNAQVESLRYRGEDVARSITRNTIKEARQRELKAELLNSSKLKEYFEDHAAERQLLRHDKPLHKTPQAPHLRHLPAYLKDPTLIKGKSATGNNREGQPMLPHRKARKLPPPPEASIQGTTSASFAPSSKEDPLKLVKGFARAPKKRGHDDEEMTEMEKRATEAGLKEARKRAKKEGNIPQVQALAKMKSTARRIKRKR